MYFFFVGKGSRQLKLLLVEAANGVTPAIQGLNTCSGVITPRILGRGIYPQDSRGGVNFEKFLIFRFALITSYLFLKKHKKNPEVKKKTKKYVKNIN